MKINQYIIALTLFFAVTSAQPAQAGFWDVFTAPFKGVVYVAQTIWAHRPVSKVDLMLMENELKQGITENHQVLRKSIVDNSEQISLQFDVLKRVQEQEKTEALAAVVEAQTLNIETVPGLAQKLQGYQHTSSAETALIQNRAAIIQEEGASILEKIIALKLQQLENDKSDQKNAEALLGINGKVEALKNELSQMKTGMGTQMLLTKRVQLTAAAVLAQRGPYSQFSRLSTKYQ